MKRTVLWTGLLTGALYACVGETGSKRFAFQAAIGGELANSERFVNQRGWSIQLTKATMTLGPLYLNVVPALRTDWTRPFHVKSAWAHGEGHLSDGRIAGELLGQATFDALSGGLVGFPVAGSMTQEEIRTTELWFYPAPGTSYDVSKIRTSALDVAGEATRDDQIVKFRGALVLDDAWLPAATEGQPGAQSIEQIRRVRGIHSPFYPTEGGHLEIRVDMKSLFRGADFSTLSNNPMDADGTRVLVQGKDRTDAVMVNLYQGLRDANGTYHIRWNDPAGP